MTAIENKYQLRAQRVVWMLVIGLALLSIRAELRAASTPRTLIAQADGVKPADEPFGFVEKLLERHTLNAVLAWLLIKFGPEMIRKHLALLDSTSNFCDTVRREGAVCQSARTIQDIHAAVKTPPVSRDP